MTSRDRSLDNFQQIQLPFPAPTEIFAPWGSSTVKANQTSESQMQRRPSSHLQHVESMTDLDAASPVFTGANPYPANGAGPTMPPPTNITQSSSTHDYQVPHQMLGVPAQTSSRQFNMPGHMQNGFDNDIQTQVGPATTPAPLPYSSQQMQTQHAQMLPQYPRGGMMSHSPYRANTPDHTQQAAYQSLTAAMQNQPRTSQQWPRQPQMTNEDQLGSMDSGYHANFNMQAGNPQLGVQNAQMRRTQIPPYYSELPQQAQSANVPRSQSATIPSTNMTTNRAQIPQSTQNSWPNQAFPSNQFSASNQAYPQQYQNMALATTQPARHPMMNTQGNNMAHMQFANSQPTNIYRPSHSGMVPQYQQQIQQPYLTPGTGFGPDHISSQMPHFHNLDLQTTETKWLDKPYQPPAHEVVDSMFDLEQERIDDSKDRTYYASMGLVQANGNGNSNSKGNGRSNSTYQQNYGPSGNRFEMNNSLHNISHHHPTTQLQQSSPPNTIYGSLNHPLMMDGIRHQQVWRRADTQTPVQQNPQGRSLDARYQRPAELIPVTYVDKRPGPKRKPQRISSALSGEVRPNKKQKAFPSLKDLDWKNELTYPGEGVTENSANQRQNIADDMRLGANRVVQTSLTEMAEAIPKVSSVAAQKAPERSQPTAGSIAQVVVQPFERAHIPPKRVEAPKVNNKQRKRLSSPALPLSESPVLKPTGYYESDVANDILGELNGGENIDHEDTPGNVLESIEVQEGLLSAEANEHNESDVTPPSHADVQDMANGSGIMTSASNLDTPKEYWRKPCMDPSHPDYNPFYVHPQELETPEGRTRAENRTLAAAFAANPTNLPSASYRRSRLNEAAELPQRRTNSAAAAAAAAALSEPWQVATAAKEDRNQESIHENKDTTTQSIQTEPQQPVSASADADIENLHDESNTSTESLEDLNDDNLTADIDSSQGQEVYTYEDVTNGGATIAVNENMDVDSAFDLLGISYATQPELDQVPTETFIFEDGFSMFDEEPNMSNEEAERWARDDVNWSGTQDTPTTPDSLFGDTVEANVEGQ